MIKKIALMVIILMLTACADTADTPTAVEEDDPPPTQVTLMLDWVPNVNHSGIFAAQENRYFDEAGLSVEIVQPGEVLAEAAVASGAADFGISFQEQVTLARARTDAPLVSLAAIIQHNTSGFASRPDLGVETPADWAGLTYGSFGTEFEEPTLRSLMACAGADFSQLEIVNIGFADPLAMMQEEQIGMAWIFYGTQGIAAEAQGIDLDVVMMSDYFDCIPDYYTPVLVTSEAMIAENPDTVRAFMGAVARGYEYVIQNPDQAADILLEYAPESDREVLRAQQAWLSPRYAEGAPRWGEQSAEVWQGYAQWMLDNGILTDPFDAESAFTNDFLP